MAYDHPIDTDDGAVPAAVRQFLRNRTLEAAGLILLAAVGAVALSLATWSVDDPSFNHAVEAVPRNLLGYPGAVAADELMQLLGLGVLAVVAVPAAWSAQLFSHRPVAHPFRSVFAWLAAIFLTASFCSTLPHPAGWALAAGLGGNAGDIVAMALTAAFSVALKGMFAN